MYDKDLGYEQTILNYMDSQGWEGNSTPDGLYFVIDEPGGETKPNQDQLITIKYNGYYSDNVQFDSNDEFITRLKNVIEGWKIGIPKFGKGGKGHLLIPPYLAYGEKPSNGIRNYSVLIFDVEIIDF